MSTQLFIAFVFLITSAVFSLMRVFIVGILFGVLSGILLFKEWIEQTRR